MAELTYRAAVAAGIAQEMERDASVVMLGEGPSLVEAITYRHGGHSRADPAKYRPDDEVEAWKARDPIPAYRARLEAAGVEAGELGAIDAAARAKVAAAEEEARAAPEPTADVLETQVWADGSSRWRN